MIIPNYNPFLPSFDIHILSKYHLIYLNLFDISIYCLLTLAALCYNLLFSLVLLVVNCMIFIYKFE